MENYYQILGVELTVNQGELESVWEDKYNEIRRLVTHHDPAVVEEANRTMRMLESARNVLFDPEKRTEYTARLSGQGISGLGDPSAKPTPAVNTPPSQAMGMVTQVPQAQPTLQPQRLDAWVCPECQRENALGTQFCASCGTQIAKACPNCRTLDFLGNKFCPNCGANKEDAFQKNVASTVSELQGQLIVLERKLQTYSKAKESVISTSDEIRKIQREYKPTGCWFTILLIIIGIASIQVDIWAVNELGSIGLLIFISLEVYLVALLYKALRGPKIYEEIKNINSSINLLKNKIDMAKKETYLVG